MGMSWTRAILPVILLAVAEAVVALPCWIDGAVRVGDEVVLTIVPYAPPISVNGKFSAHDDRSAKQVLRVKVGDVVHGMNSGHDLCTANVVQRGEIIGLELRPFLYLTHVMKKPPPSITSFMPAYREGE